jgi:hypothetical protein
MKVLNVLNSSFTREYINLKTISLDNTRLESTNQCCSVFRFLKE